MAAVVDLPKFKFHLWRRRLSQRKIARSLGIEEVTLSRWVRGQARLDERDARAIARMLGVKLADITVGEP